MKPNLLLSSLIISALVLAGCSGTLIESKKIDYKSAGKLPTLEVPPDLTSPARDERYAIPDAGKAATTFSEYSDERGLLARRSDAGVLPQVDNVRIERDGTQRWLVAPGTPDKYWPTLKEFWQGIGFSLVTEMPEAGVMETDWNENRAKLPQDFIRGTIGKALDFLYSTAERDKFRTRLEQGSTPGTTEIYISHRGMMEIYTNEGKSETRWQPRPADPELEAEMLQRLMVRLGVDGERAKTMLASPQQTEDRARLSASGDVLTVQESFDRAWRRIGLALDRVNFTVEDRDRAKGTYFVRYVDPEADVEPGKKQESKGILSRMMFWKSDKVDPKTAAQLRVIVKGEGNASLVRIQTHDGAPDDSATARKILKLLLEQLK
ncbi:Outer membrane protein assembly factor BamC [Sterolibacterium denitrificans]|uniref:Outer membrane protein assembly factor BamC n=2 Tax=Sterolibacterium denitrificans TaxID=157592 RepID=A0A7Z7HST6_9PROT|nr:outer membrane protein assembly factor BamC [Sterolibacterium denitrificans]KYC29331.1 lipoprotein [Sterolibacterium denitrificans]SMB30802.1 Outer membrane protein assembly factor BamC [Sterolibacterium denitrificans]